MKNEVVDIAALTVNETVRLFPGTVAVFSRHAIDSCCGGALPVAEAAARHGVDLDELLQELRQVE